MEEFRLKLFEVCNESKLPIEAIYFVVKDVFRDVQDAYKEYQAQRANALKNQVEEPTTEETETEKEGTN